MRFNNRWSTIVPHQIVRLAATDKIRSADTSRQTSGTGCLAEFGAADNLPGARNIWRHSFSQFTPPQGQPLSNRKTELTPPDLRRKIAVINYD
jgi:hypothetical protein